MGSLCSQRGACSASGGCSCFYLLFGLFPMALSMVLACLFMVLDMVLACLFMVLSMVWLVCSWFWLVCSWVCLWFWLVCSWVYLWFWLVCSRVCLRFGLVSSWLCLWFWLVCLWVRPGGLLAALMDERCSDARPASQAHPILQLSLYLLVGHPLFLRTALICLQLCLLSIWVPAWDPWVPLVRHGVHFRVVGASEHAV